MTDVFSKLKRSVVMAAIRSRGNKRTELKLVSILRTHGITGWRRHQLLPGRPDFVFPRQRLAIFVDGCFWHGCPSHLQRPRQNALYWKAKIAMNLARDRKVDRELPKLGWNVIRIWEHSLKSERRILSRLKAGLQAGKSK